jgi:hypothetical protein
MVGILGLMIMKLLKGRLVLRDLNDNSKIIPLRLNSSLDLEWVVFKRDFLGEVTVYPASRVPLSPIVNQKDGENTIIKHVREGTPIYEGDVISYGSSYNKQSRLKAQIPAYILERR